MIHPWVEEKSGRLAHDMPYNTFKVAWSIAHGTAHMKMNWVYTWEECFPKEPKPNRKYPGPEID